MFLFNRKKLKFKVVKWLNLDNIAIMKGKFALLSSDSRFRAFVMLLRSLYLPSAVFSNLGFLFWVSRIWYSL